MNDKSNKNFGATKKILEILGKSSFITLDLFDFLFSGMHRMSKSQFKDFKKRSRNRRHDLDKYLMDVENKQRFYSLLYKFNDNLIA